LDHNERFAFTPDLPGLWKYKDFVSGETAAIEVVPSG
jgi:hypothetical protein